jgi:flagellar biosynthesis GTPase FlhF
MNNNANITTKTTDQSSATAERNIICTFSDTEDPSPNYLRRVKAHHAGAFVTGVNELAEVLEGDILIKLPGKNPWLAQYRELVETPAPTPPALTALTALTVPKGATLEEFTDEAGNVGAARVTLADGTLMFYGNINLIPVQHTTAATAALISHRNRRRAEDKKDAEDKKAAEDAEAIATAEADEAKAAQEKAAKKAAADKKAAEDKKAGEEVEAKAAQEKADKKAATAKKAADKKAKAGAASQGK